MSVVLTPPPDLTTPGFSWALSASASGAAGRVLDRLLRANGSLATGAKSHALMQHMLAVDPNGPHSYILQRGWAAHGMGSGTMILTHTTTLGATAYPFVLRWPAARKRPAIERQLDAIVATLPPAPKHIGCGMADIGQRPLPVWLSMPSKPIASPDPLRSVLIVCLEQAMRDTFEMTIMGHTLSCHHPNGLTSLGFRLSDKLPTPWLEAFARLCTDDAAAFPLAQRIAQEPIPHIIGMPTNWGMEAQPVTAVNLKRHNLSLSGHDRMQAHSLAAQYGLTPLQEFLP